MEAERKKSLSKHPHNSAETFHAVSTGYPQHHPNHPQHPPKKHPNDPKHPQQPLSWGWAHNSRVSWHQIEFAQWTRLAAHDKCILAPKRFVALTLLQCECENLCDFVMQFISYALHFSKSCNLSFAQVPSTNKQIANPMHSILRLQNCFIC